MKKSFTAAFATAVATAAALVAPVAFAHPGHDVASGAMAGLMHPLGGLDHLSFLTCVGALLALGPARARIRSALAVFAALAAGALLGLAGIHLPAVEWFLAVSVLLTAAALFLTPGTSTVVVTSAMVLFALFHGFAHGAEASGARTAFVVAFLLSSAGVVTLSALIARTCMQRTAARLALGTAAGASGFALLAGLLVA